MSDFLRNGHVAGFAGLLAIVIVITSAAIIGEQQQRNFDRINQESMNHVGR